MLGRCRLVEVGGCEGEEKGKCGEERKQGRRKGCIRMFPTADGNHLTDNVRTGSLTWIRGVRAGGMVRIRERWRDRRDRSDKQKRCGEAQGLVQVRGEV